MFACRFHLFTPFLAPNKDKERLYNAAHIKTNNLIERAFRVLKRRFALLPIPVRTKLSNIKNIIIARSVLHNNRMTHRLPFGDENAGVDDFKVGEIKKADNIEGGANLRPLLLAGGSFKV